MRINSASPLGSGWVQVMPGDGDVNDTSVVIRKKAAPPLGGVFGLPRILAEHLLRIVKCCVIISIHCESSSLSHRGDKCKWSSLKAILQLFGHKRVQCHGLDKSKMNFLYDPAHILYPAASTAPVCLLLTFFSKDFDFQCFSRGVNRPLKPQTVV